jgi:hypothetical protein
MAAERRADEAERSYSLASTYAARLKDSLDTIERAARAVLMYQPSHHLQEKALDALRVALEKPRS